MQSVTKSSADADPFEAVKFNQCDYGLNHDRFQALSIVPPPLVLIIDPRTAHASMRTIDALRHVQVDHHI